jgi:hypothetical protein
VFAFAWLTAVVIQAATFTASLDRDTVVVGEPATLTLKFDGAQPKSVPAFPAIPNLQIVSQGGSQNFTLVNGDSSVTYSYTFAVIPTQPGNFTIPMLRAEVGGKILATQPLKLNAVKAETAAAVAGNSGDQLAFLKLFVPKKEVYVGEICSVQLQLFIRDGVANGDGILESLERMAASSSPLKVEGCNVLKSGYAQRRVMQIGNFSYHVATLVTAITPVKTGTITINSINATIALQLPSGNRRRDGWDPFGMFQQYEERRVPIAAEAVTLTSLAVPENAPSNFNGAVGSYTMSVIAGPTNVAAGDPITVKIQLSGNGALDSLSLPEQSAWHDFKAYPPSSFVTNTDVLGIQGTKVFEQVVVPQSAEIKELPPIVFSYFDSDKKQFETLRSPAIGLIVRPGGFASVPVAAIANRATQEAPPAQDIVSIKQRPGKLERIGPPLVEQPWFLALQSVPALAFIGTVIWRKRSDSLANNPRLRRQRKVAQIIRAGIQDLKKLAAEKNSDEFFATLFRLLQEQLGERLDLPASAITEAVIEEHLQSSGLSETTLTGLQELFQSNNLARYAPVRSSQELEALIPRLESVLGDLQGLKA